MRADTGELTLSKGSKVRANSLAPTGRQISIFRMKHTAPTSAPLSCFARQGVAGNQLTIFDIAFDQILGKLP